MNFFGVGGLELLVIMVVAMLVLGPTRLVEYSRTLGKLMGDLRRSTEGLHTTMEDLLEERASPELGEDGEKSSFTPPQGSRPRPKRHLTRRRPPTSRRGSSEKP